MHIWESLNLLQPHSFIKISVSIGKWKQSESPLPVYCVCIGVTRVNEWDNKSALMVLISQNTSTDVDSAEPYGRLIVIRAVTLPPAARTVAEIFVTGKVHPGSSGCVCQTLLSLAFTVCRIYWEHWEMAGYQYGQKNRREGN